MNSAEQLRAQHHDNTFGMSKIILDQVVEDNKDRLVSLAAGMLSDIQELLASAPASVTRDEVIRKQLNVAKYVMFESNVR